MGQNTGGGCCYVLYAGAAAAAEPLESHSHAGSPPTPQSSPFALLLDLCIQDAAAAAAEEEEEEEEGLLNLSHCLAAAASYGCLPFL